MNSIEVLSPVGSEEMLVAAVRAGADAVYLGAGDFNARRNAANFGEDELRKAIEYCRVRGVRVYLTLNILIRDDEMAAAVSLARMAYLAGIDGIIVQDLGLAHIIREAAPSLPLHASTQMSVHSKSALAVLKAMGFCRVVAAREMSFEDLKELCKEARRLDMEIEVFVHGALCMCVSGQCMLSSMLGTRSGNRGLCAGPCRLPFTARGKGEDYALSLKDLSLIEHIQALKDIGVASLKIEGRLKRPEYVAAATAAVRAATIGKSDTKLNDLLCNVFSRSGFTDGYFTNRVDADMFGVRTKEDMQRSKAALPVIHSLYRAERQSVPIKITARICAGEHAQITVTDGVITVKNAGGIAQEAKNKAIEAKQIETALKKLGGTPYYAKEVDITLDEGLFISNASLNELRRGAVEKLELQRKKIEKTLPCFTLLPPDGHEKQRTSFIISVTDAHQLMNISFTKRIAAVVLPLECAVEIELDECIEKYVDIPRGIQSEEKITELLVEAKKKGFTGALCGNLAAISLAKSVGFKVIAGFSMNVYNSYTAQCLADMGALAAVASPEMHIRYAKAITAKIKKVITVYGRLPLMLLKNCPVKAQIGCKNCGGKGELVDRKAKAFPVRCRMGFSELYNCVPICLDKAEDINCADYAMLYFTDETKEQVGEIVNGYLNEKIKTPSEFTRGLYYRNVE